MRFVRNAFTIKVELITNDRIIMLIVDHLLSTYKLYALKVEKYIIVSKYLCFVPD